MTTAFQQRHILAILSVVSSKRLFLAIHLSDELRAKLEAVQEALAAHEKAVRLVTPANMHLTLHFLGDTSEELLPALTDGMRTALSPFEAFDTTVRRGGCFPSPRKPRVFWTGVDGESGPLGDVHAALGTELEKLEFELDSRPFSPHITIGYARKRADRSELSRAASDLAEAAEKRLGTEGTRFPVKAVSLVESVLGRGGPQYTDLERVALAGA